MVSTDLLRQVSLFSGLSGEQLSRIAEICREEIHQKSAIIVREKEPSNDLYIIREGTAEVALGTASAPGPTPILHLGRGQIFGEMSLIDRGLRSATVRATSDRTVLYAIGRDDFIDLCDQDTHIGYIVMRNLAADLSFKLRHYNLAWR
ncbi:MAG: cyclic nucleotide-binding domain-containing protein [Chloroflexota bacterium]